MAPFSRLIGWLLGRTPAVEPTPPPPVVPAVAPVVPVVAPVAPPDASVAARLVAAHNAERSTRSRQPLVADTRLQAAAQAHADFMARAGRTAHEGIGDGTPWSRIADAGYRYASAGENVAAFQADVAAVMAAWMNSPGHRANILAADFVRIGAARGLSASGRPYWCVTLAAPLPAASPVGAPQPMTHTPVSVEAMWRDSDGCQLCPAAYYEPLEL